MKILLSLSSRKMRNGKTNPKDYPYGDELVELLQKEGYAVVQARTTDNLVLEQANEVQTNLSLKQLAQLIQECDAIIAVDNFIQHYATYLNKKPIIVIFSKSDPLIYGYSQNINILKSRNYLMKNQFQTWEQDVFDKDAFVKPEVIIKKLKTIILDK